MRFILRCVFWLAIVYASMAWSRGVFNHVHIGASAPADAARQAVMSLAEKTKDRAADYCRHHTSECLTEAAKLGALFSTASTADQQSFTADASTVSPTVVPLPVPDPRRHARDAKLAATR